MKLVDHFSFYSAQKHAGKMDAETTTFRWLCKRMSEFASEVALAVYQDVVLLKII